jgi:hypothetical protein
MYLTEEGEEEEEEEEEEEKRAQFPMHLMVC